MLTFVASTFNSPPWSRILLTDGGFKVVEVPASIRIQKKKTVKQSGQGGVSEEDALFGVGEEVWRFAGDEFAFLWGFESRGVEWVFLLFSGDEVWLFHERDGRVRARKN